jgi:hypothetical protein
MVDDAEKSSVRHIDSFADQAIATQPGIIAEFLDFLIHNKKWWLTPIVLVLAFVGTLIVVGGTPLAPFIYVLF